MDEQTVTQIKGYSLPDAFFQTVRKLIETGYHYKIDKGSNEGQQRLTFPYFIVITIANAYAEPYDLMLPKLKPEVGIPNPVDNGYIEEYVPYLMTDAIEDNEQYTYGNRIFKSMNHWINQLKTTPNTAQAILQVAEPNDHLLEHPPCMRHIDMKIMNDQLIFYPYFRSWDLWGGFPANLAAIAVLQKYMADLIGVDTGLIIASSKDLHLYDYIDELIQAYGEGYFKS